MLPNSDRPSDTVGVAFSSLFDVYKDTYIDSKDTRSQWNTDPEARLHIIGAFYELIRRWKDHMINERVSLTEQKHFESKRGLIDNSIDACLQLLVRREEKPTRLREKFKQLQEELKQVYSFKISF